MLKTFSITDIGRRRKINQDYVFTSEIPVGCLPNLFLVADGMGGHNAGDYASKYTIETIVEQIGSWKEAQSPVAAIERALKTANSEILQKASQDADLNGMGTTLVAATLLGDTLCVANVGDSRLYVVNREIRQITKDHSLVEEMVRMGSLQKEQARMHPDKNIITRAIGVQEELEVDFFQVKLNDDDMILMCTDGLTNMLEDEEIRMILQGQRDIVEKAEALVEAANQNGGKDNITVILIEPFADEVNS